ncbi:MAG: protoporphyrinogen oxidase [Armatimonadetes bacterium]|nr:protoporphyrinogen oxidase [Armatimonadota bacterium]
MANILFVYGTTEGHTRTIAQRMGGYIRSQDHVVDVVDSADVRENLDLTKYDAFVLAGSLHQGFHQRPLAHFIKHHLDQLTKKPSVFLSVSLTAVHKDREHQEEVQKCIKRFLAETGWEPTKTRPVEGALKYIEYDWFKRMIMKSIAKKEGGDTDTSHDHEYTDWEGLEVFLEGFLQESFNLAKATT